MSRLLPIDERLERAGQLVVRSRIFFDIWSCFEGADTIIDAMPRYSEFFRFDPHAHFVAFIVSIVAMFDKRKNTISLFRLANETKAARLIPIPVSAEVDTLLTEAAPLATKTAILRHHLFAHRSASTTYADAFKKAAVTEGELRYLTDIALRIANGLMLARGLRDQCFNPLPREHAEAMLKALAQNNPSP
jgi:hypothetical protein